MNDYGIITGIDALLIINDINPRPEGEGEFVSALAAADLDGGAPPRSSAGQTKSPPPIQPRPAVDLEPDGGSTDWPARETSPAFQRQAAIAESLLDLLASDRLQQWRAKRRARS